ncbi:endo-1,4-beta-xylanase [Cerasicoccus frondis]|uniref:endo-1,4-beta-xylanase n=1 Tax=Cerasicoccus frondis TaxID=490090 RepID=UPI0028525D58|nr:endo-1,4-beta-xylanase [Cerasicoccus frondis]
MKPLYLVIVFLLSPIWVNATVLEPKNPDFAEGLQAWPNRMDNTEAITIQLKEGPAPTALQLTVSPAPEKPWFTHIRQAIKAKFYPTETIEVSAMMRSPDNCTIAIALQSTRPPFAPILYKREELTPDWKKVTLKGKTNQPLDAGQAQFNFTLGFDAGVIEMTDVQLRFPERENIDDVPSSFGELSWSEDKLPVVLSQDFPIPSNGRLPEGELRSIVDGINDFSLLGKRFGEMETVAVTGQHFDKAIRLTTLKDTPKPYSIQIAEPLIHSVDKGDTLVALFSYRVVEPNPHTHYGASQFSVEKSGGKYERLISWGLSSDDTEWHHCVLPFKADFEVLAGASQIIFRGGYGPQTIEIGGVALLNLGKGVNLSKLPSTPMDYIGSSPDAPWRQEALSRIEKIRKGDFTLKITDSSGNALTGVKVVGKLTNHAYGFGSALGAPILLPDSKKYDEQFGINAAQLFNAGSLENAMKWKRSTMPGVDQQIEDGLAWMEKQGWRIRGHTLVWPSWRYNTAEVKKLKDDPEALQAAILERIHDFTTKYAGRIKDWDVINEPYTNHDFMDILGEDAMATWLQAARDGDPNSKLFINDFDIVTRSGSGNPKIDYYMQLIERFQKNNTPMDGIGLQSHFVGSLTPIPHVYEIIDSFAQKGLTVQLTELTVNIPDEETQASYVRDFITIAFSHPSTDLIQTWGFWAGYMWEPEAAMFRKDWSPKPLAESYRALVQETFCTQVEETTNKAGEISFRGYYGKYTFTAHIDGKPVTFDATFGPEQLNANEALAN